MLSEQDLLDILSSSADATAIYDSSELHIRFVNDAMLHIWGKDKSILGKTFEDALPEVSDQPFTELLKGVWKNKKVYTATDTPATLFVNGQLKTSFFDFEYRPLLNPSGETYAILHTARDITSRVLAWQQVSERQLREEQLISELSATGKDVQAANDNLSKANAELTLSNQNITRLNERLQETETDFKRLVQQAPVAMLVFRGKDLVIDLANHAMLEILDKDASVIGKPLLEGLPEIKGEPAVDLLFDVFNTGRSFDGSEAPVRMKRNGVLETAYFNFSYRPLMDNGQIVGVMDVAVEVTEQVLARKKLEHIIAEKTTLEQTLRANEQRLQGILDTMAEGVIIVDEHCTPTYANPMAQRIMGISEEDFKARRYYDTKWQNQRIDGSPLSPEDHPMNVVLRTGLAVYDQEVAIVLPSNQKIYISINAAPLVNEQGVVTGGIATFMDVTHRRMVLQQKEDFISVASHELRTPVTSLKLAIQQLDRMQANIRPDALSRLVGQANKSLAKLSDLVNSLLSSNRLSEGRFPIVKKIFSLPRLINDCCQHIRTAAKHEIIFTGVTELEVNADEQLIDQVVVNLVNNAVKYAHGSDRILVDVSGKGNEARVSITDFGPGIPPEKVPYLFERYYQAGDSAGAISGLGLGLYICAEIVEKHGGKIGVDTEIDKGSTFWFTLPIKV